MLASKQQIVEEVARILVGNPEMIRAIRKRYITDDMWDHCIENCPELFRFRPHPSYEFCEKALQLDGANIRYVPKKLLCTELCELAVLSSPRAIHSLPSIYWTQRLMRLACDGDVSLIGELSSLEPSYIRHKIKAIPSAIKYLKNPSDDLIEIAIEQDPNAILYFEHISSRIRKKYQELYPNYGI